MELGVMNLYYKCFYQDSSVIIGYDKQEQQCFSYQSVRNTYSSRDERLFYKVFN
jgi:hypothetical protein